METATSTRYNGVSTGNGYYVFPALKPGSYTVTVDAHGFKKASVSSIVVSVERRTSQDFKLEVGSTDETINVVGNALAIETESSDIGTSIQPEQVIDLPLAVTGNLRSLSTLSFLAPGAVGPGTSPDPTISR